MMVVQELGQLLAQAFVALGLVAEHDGPLEQSLLQRVRKSLHSAAAAAPSTRK
jgi:hypothetical protein